jgi:hypothetical protein
VCVPFGAWVSAGLLSERPARGWWQIDATCQRYGCKFIATSAKEDKVHGKCQEAVDVASILSAYPQCRLPPVPGPRDLDENGLTLGEQCQEAWSTAWSTAAKKAAKAIDDEGARRRNFKGGMSKAIDDARHAADPALAADACGRIGSLASEGPANRDLLGAAGAAGHVASVLRGHPEDKMVQQWGCNALGWLAKNHPANQSAAAEVGAAGLVATAMRGHPEESDVQWAGCFALVRLAENHPANTAAAREAGCVQLIASALRGHAGESYEDKTVQEEGRGALRILEPGHPTPLSSMEQDLAAPFAVRLGRGGAEQSDTPPPARRPPPRHEGREEEDLAARGVLLLRS